MKVRTFLADSRSQREPIPDPSGVCGSFGTLDDAAWITRVRAGDEEAARAMVLRLYPLVIKVVLANLPRRSSAEDLAQVIFVKVFRGFRQFSGQVPLEHWVARIAVNTCRNQFKHDRVRPELRWADLTEAEEQFVRHRASHAPDYPAHHAFENRDLLEKLLARLEPDERLVITLVHLEERSTEEISQLLGWTPSRVKVKAFRTRHKMRKLWKAFST